MMKVQTYKELEGLIPKVESDLETAIQEREDLNLSIPQNYGVLLTYYYSENAQASAQKTSQGSVIHVNALRTVSDLFQGQDRDKLSEICYFFDVTRNFLKYESWIMEAIKNPEEAIPKFEKEAFQSEQNLQAYKEGFKLRGRTYDFYKDYVIKNAGHIKETLDELMPKIKEEFGKADLSLRHELDHSAFFESPIYQDYVSKQAIAQQLRYKLHAEKDLSVSKDYAKANMEVLKLMTEVQPLIEPRALFFNHINPGEWDKADFEKVKNKVYANFLLGYIECAYPQAILDPLVSQKWSKGEMDTATSMFLFYTVNNQRQSANSTAYVIEPEKVNYKTASKILYKEIPKWKAKLAKNALTATQAISDAYKENPSRLKQANQAKTFEEFIKVCKNG